MDNSTPNQTEPEPEPESEFEPQPVPEMVSESYLNERIKRLFDRIELTFKDARAHYLRSPRLQKTTYQGKYLPAFWTVACIFSLVVNVILIALLIGFGRNFFSMKALIGKGLINNTSDNLALMDQAHIVTSVSVQTEVQLQNNLPVKFNLAVNQNTQLLLAQDTRIPGAYIYLNNTAVLTDLTLPAKTPIQVSMNMSIPVDTSVPISMTVPLSMQVPVDIAIDQTDLHQSIVGLQGVIEPYKTLMGSTYNSSKDFPLCDHWWSGWMCTLFFGKQ